MNHRTSVENCRWHQNWEDQQTQEQSGRQPVYYPVGARHRDGASLIWAHLRNCGNLSQRWQGKGTSNETCEADSTDALYRDGQVRRSDEIAVMAMEQRDLAAQLRAWSQLRSRRSS